MVAVILVALLLHKNYESQEPNLLLCRKLSLVVLSSETIYKLHPAVFQPFWDQDSYSQFQSTSEVQNNDVVSKTLWSHQEFPSIVVHFCHFFPHYGLHAPLAMRLEVLSIVDPVGLEASSVHPQHEQQRTVAVARGSSGSTWGVEKWRSHGLSEKWPGNHNMGAKMYPLNFWAYILRCWCLESFFWR